MNYKRKTLILILLITGLVSAGCRSYEKEFVNRGQTEEKNIQESDITEKNKEPDYEKDNAKEINANDKENSIEQEKNDKIQIKDTEEKEEKKNKRKPESEEEENMDENTKKMMAEGKGEETQNGQSGDEITNYGGTDIYTFCPAKLLAKRDDEKYGELVHKSYYSGTCEKERNVNILLPAGYNSQKNYPVLYVLHGIFGDEYSMVGDEKSGIPITIGNMINDGVMKEAIVVFPFIYASKTKDQCTAIDDENVLAYDNFVNDLKNDLMPFLEKNYSIATGKENTAITGFSMGGRESLAIGFYEPDLFGYVGAIAPAPGLIPSKDWAMEHKGQFKEDELIFKNAKPYFVMVCCGDDDKVVGTFPKVYHELLLKNGVEHIWWEIPGSDHGDPAISSGIYNFCKEIF